MDTLQRLRNSRPRALENSEKRSERLEDEIQRMSSSENGGDAGSRRSSDVEWDEEEADDFFSSGPATVDDAQDPLLERPSRQVLRAPQGKAAGSRGNAGARGKAGPASTRQQSQNKLRRLSPAHLRRSGSCSVPAQLCRCFVM